MTALVAITAAMVVGLISTHDRWWRLVFKPAASAGFVAIGLASGAPASVFGRWILLGLVLGAIGDIALLGDDDRSFILGLGSFLLGHLAYVFALAPDANGPVVASAVVAALLAVTSWQWIQPGLPSPLKAPVACYILVISGMVFVALAGASHRPLAAVGAALFAASDLFVARERFVITSPYNPRVGLPLYYTGQVLIALSVGA